MRFIELLQNALLRCICLTLVKSFTCVFSFCLTGDHHIVDGHCDQRRQTERVEQHRIDRLSTWYHRPCIAQSCAM